MTRLLSPRAKRANSQQGAERNAPALAHVGRDTDTVKPLRHRTPTPVTDKLGRTQRTPPPLTDKLSRAQKQELDWLRSSLYQIRTVMDSMSEDIYFKDRDGAFTRVNRAMANHLGLADPEQAIGRSEKDFLCREEAERRCRDDEEIVRRGRILVDVEEKWHLPGRSERWLSTTKIPLRDSSGLIVGTFGISRDITEKKRFEAELEQKGFYDPLTQLPNRAMFDKRVERLVTRARLLGASTPLFAIAWLDLDRFKCINESLGHGAGDELLVRTARRLEACLRPGDVLARVVGDQFTILLDDLHSESDAVRVAERIQNAMSMPLTVGGTEVFTSVSIGVALSSSGYTRHDDMLRDAYTALYRAKAAGRARHEIFDADMHRRAVDQLQLETDLRRAIDRQEWTIHYQPIVDLQTRRLAGFEALARWRHPSRGLVMPDLFIPTAEETGLIRPLGMWVMREACRQMRHWHDVYGGEPALGIAVNLSTRQLTHADLPAQVRAVLEETGLRPSSLTLEITESALMQSLQVGAAVLQELHEMDVHLDVDDFGTGYSSLAYLQSFPVQTLKVDRSFIRCMHSGAQQSEIVRAIVGLAHNLGMDVTAEGVETPQQIESLRALNCRRVQGFYFSRPIPAEEAEHLIASGAPAYWGEAATRADALTG
jgi:diguanylate cyclase (GGDEF)-like protein/PAS domain S-box-containing protein